MKWIPLQCPSCSAPLEVPRDQRRAACEWCGTTFDRDEPKAAPAPAARRAEPLRQLDEDWVRERDRMLKVVDGVGSLPTSNAWIGGFLVGAFGIVWTVLAAGIGAPLPFPLFGVVFTVLAVRTAVRTRRRLRDFDRSREHYSQQRRELLDRRS